MNHEEALILKRNKIAEGNGSVKENKVYIIPEISEEADVFLQLVLRNKVKYTDDLCKGYSSNGKFSVWLDV
ncbi:hypothetical protein [Chryseobacterium jejuense]|uniref:Uncharacterized protein n=1 Tax=Chryseobacterium jejuense TaxID=445960 RepID=A0A2X2VMQ6_CHRJE|nr:hypothetical protein [Chryseobacterium jejuense]SDI40181.1 hypothetical protein SAMN05421542_1103 [Chryseobacterium jejuense]SQB26961.1 Uncharacterised protein [Chryseobacterium jejuense]